MNLFPLRNVLNRHFVVRITLRLRRHIKHGQRRNQTLRRDLIYRPHTAHQSRRGIDIGIAGGRRGNSAQSVLLHQSRSTNRRMVMNAGQPSATHRMRQVHDS